MTVSAAVVSPLACAGPQEQRARLGAGKQAADPVACSTDVSQLRAHVETMRFNGWSTKNHDANMPMFGCEIGSDAIDCLSGFDEIQQRGTESGRMRLLFQLGRVGQYAYRSSPDGRFAGPGTPLMVDLQHRRKLLFGDGVDPVFFPDGAGFAVLTGEGGVFCPLEVLKTDGRISFDRCWTHEVEFYATLAAEDGGDRFLVEPGVWQSDTAGLAPGQRALHGDAGVKVTVLQNTGTGFEVMQRAFVETPGEVDHVISPTGTLLVGRALAADLSTTAFVVRSLDRSKGADGYDFASRVVGRICLADPGEYGKPAISYDERFFAYHRRQSAATDSFVVDLLTGNTTRLSQVETGEEALFPHFRSDGWIYLVLVDRDGDRIIASDAALRIAAGESLY